MAICPDVICSKGGFVLVIRIGDLPMGSGTLGLQCYGKRFYPLPDHIRANGSSGDPTDQALKKPLKFKILAEERANRFMSRVLQDQTKQ